MPRLIHKDTVVFAEVTPTGYGNKKVVSGQFEVKGTFLQNTGFIHSNNQDLIESDAILYPNERDPYIKSYHNRLEGMYVIVALYGADQDVSWFKVTSVSVNRDHLLRNRIDNIMLTLKKTESLPGVS